MPEGSSTTGGAGAWPIESQSSPNPWQASIWKADTARLRFVWFELLPEGSFLGASTALEETVEEAQQLRFAAQQGRSDAAVFDVDLNAAS